MLQPSAVRFKKHHITSRPFIVWVDIAISGLHNCTAGPPPCAASSQWSCHPKPGHLKHQGLLTSQDELNPLQDPFAILGCQVTEVDVPVLATRHPGLPSLCQLHQLRLIQFLKLFSELRPLWPIELCVLARQLQVCHLLLQSLQTAVAQVSGTSY